MIKRRIEVFLEDKDIEQAIIEYIRKYDPSAPKEATDACFEILGDIKKVSWSSPAATTENEAAEQLLMEEIRGQYRDIGQPPGTKEGVKEDDAETNPPTIQTTS